jgi:hypothetical protein
MSKLISAFLFWQRSKIPQIFESKKGKILLFSLIFLLVASLAFGAYTYRKYTLGEKSREQLPPEYYSSLQERTRAQDLSEEGGNLQPGLKSSEKRSISKEATKTDQAASSQREDKTKTGQKEADSSGEKGTAHAPAGSASSAGSLANQGGDQATSPEPYGTTPLSSLLPRTINGFRTGTLVEKKDEAIADYYAVDQSKIYSLLITVRERGSESEADKFINQVNKVAFNRNAQEGITISGRTSDAYFGTDTTSYAVLAWHEGSKAFELLAWATNHKPATLLPDLLAVAAQMPAGKAEK